MHKWRAMDRPISFRDSAAPRLSVAAYTPGNCTATNRHEGVAFMPLSITITVVALAVTGPFLPSNGKLSKSCAKIALSGINCALRQQCSNCGKKCAAQDRSFLGGLCVSVRNQPTRPTQPFILTGLINQVPTYQVGMKSSPLLGGR